MKTRRGFSLIELVVVLAIIALLAAITVPTVAAMTRKSQESRVAEAMVLFLDEARGAAIRTGHPSTVDFPGETQGRYTCLMRYKAEGPMPIGAILNVQDRTYDVETGRTADFPAGMTVDNPPPSRFMFLADGSCVAVARAAVALYPEDYEPVGGINVAVTGTRFYVRDGVRRRLVTISAANGTIRIAKP